MRQWIRVAKQEQVTGQKFVNVAPALDALDSVSQFMRVHNLGFVLPRFFWPCMPRFFGDVKLVEGSNGNSPKTIAAAMSMLKYGARYQEVLSSPIVIHTLKFCNLSHRALAKATHESESLFLKLSHEIIDSMQSLVDGSYKLKSDLQQAVIRDFYLSSGATQIGRAHV